MGRKKKETNKITGVHIIRLCTGTAKMIKNNTSGNNTKGYFYYLNEDNKYSYLDCMGSSPKETVFDTYEEFEKYIYEHFEPDSDE